jgi:hypothetical protein
VTFLRLTRGDLVAAVAALALLVVMAGPDWYGTKAGDAAREASSQTSTSGGQSGEIGRAVKADAKRIAELGEQNAWQADEPVDRLILFALVSAAVMATAAAWLRAARVRFTPPLTPSAVATWVGLVATMLLAFRIAQKPATDAGAVVKFGAPLGLVCVGVLALGARYAWRAETAAAAPATDVAPRVPEREAELVAARREPAPSLWDDDTDETWAIGWDHDTDETEAIKREDVPPPRDKRRRRRRGGR